MSVNNVSVCVYVRRCLVGSQRKALKPGPLYPSANNSLVQPVLLSMSWIQGSLQI